MNKKNRFLLLLICILAGAITLSIITSCSTDNGSGHSEDTGIILGKTVEPSHPLASTIVAIVSEIHEGQALCTGTILNEETVLTAAHCVDESPSRLRVVFGINAFDAREDQIRQADRFVQHPEWMKSKDEGDLALIHFKGGLPEGFHPVRLAEPTTHLTRGLKTTLMGYGVTNGITRVGSGRLRLTESQILEKKSETQYVTDGHATGVCFGDSGGPAFAITPRGFAQWGVASSVSNRTCRETSIHTSLLAYEPWIRSTAARLKSLD